MWTAQNSNVFATTRYVLLKSRLLTHKKTTLRKNYEEFESIFNVKRFQNQVRVVKQGIRLALFLKRLIRCDNHLQTIVNHEH